MEVLAGFGAGSGAGTWSPKGEALILIADWLNVYNLGLVEFA
jgi:hypothetical protein